MQLHLGQIEAVQLAGAATHHVALVLLRELDVLGAANLGGHVHAIDDLADGLLEGLRLFFKGDELVVEVGGEDIAFFHVALHGGLADGFGLLLGGVALALHVRELRVGDDCGRLEGRDAGVHGARFDGADHALGDERDDVAAEGVFKRRFAHGLQEGQQAVHGGGAGVEQRLELEMEIGVPDLVHPHLVIARG